MATVTTRLTSNPSAYYAEIRDPRTGIAGRTIRRLAVATANEAANTAPDGSDNGHASKGAKLKDSHTVRDPQPSRSGKFLTALVINTAPHARYVARGTGVRGGRGPIEGFQQWQTMSGPYAGAWKTVSRDGKRGYTRGQTPNPWIVEAYNRARRQVGVRNVKPMSTPRRTVSVSVSGANPTVVPGHQFGPKQPRSGRGAISVRG